MQKRSMSWYYKIGSGVGAFILWGGWAWFANAFESPISALAQGVFSFTMTLLIVVLLTHLFPLFSTPKRRIFFPSILMTVGSTFCMVILHWLVGTPEIIRTIAPVSIVALIFCLYTCYRLEQSYERR